MKCHFVPQSYLKRFLNSDNLLECFDLFRTPSDNKPNANPIKTKPAKKTAQIEDWYILHAINEIPSLDFSGEKRIEEDFQRIFENDLTPSLDRLENKTLTKEDKDTIAHFIAFQLHRVPVSRSYYREMQLGVDIDQMSNEEKAQKVAETIQGFIATSISGLTLAPFLSESKWLLLENRTDTPFVTSDNPVQLSNHPSNMDHLHLLLQQRQVSGPELAARQTAYTISLSPKKLLYINTSMPTEPDDVKIFGGYWDSKEKVKAFNDLVFRSSLSCIYSNNKSIIEEYHRRFASGEIKADLFVDDPWGDESNPK